MTPDAIANDAYTELAARYDKRIDTKAHNAYYERPATLALLGRVAGLRVLDAGCGVGKYAEILSDAGAEVVGLDANARMLERARRRLGVRAVQLIHASLDHPLDGLESASFDIVLAALSLDYVRDWVQAFAEFERVLRPRGRVVFSVTHPLADFLAHRSRAVYFEIERVEYVWRGFGGAVTMPSFRRSFADVITPVLAAGFQLQTVLEPRPQDAFRAVDPDEYAKLMREPGFLCVSALKPETSRPR